MGEKLLECKKWVVCVLLNWWFCLLIIILYVSAFIIFLYCVLVHAFFFKLERGFMGLNDNHFTRETMRKSLW